jgi:hypothetical protein
MNFDPAQRFVRLIAGGRGVIYAVQADGLLRWYRHAGWTTGGVSWANGVGREIDTDWHTFRAVLAGAEGQLYTVSGDGSLRWWRYDLTTPDGGDGQGSWHPQSGSVIHTGFDAYPRVFGGYDDTLYGVASDGTLWWHRYIAGDGSSGSAAWAADGIGQRIGRGFQRFPRLAAAPSGVVFGAEVAGVLSWWRYLAGDGTAGPNAWALGGVRTDIGSGWASESLRDWTVGADGELYAIALDLGAVPDMDHMLRWYRLTNFLTVDQGGVSAAWAHPPNGVPIGQGFTLEEGAALQGYVEQQSVAPGETAQVAVSTTFDTYDIRVRRLVPAPAVVRRVSTITPGDGLQILPPGYRSNGCGWPVSLGVAVGDTWASGVYDFELTGPDQLRRHAVFVVRPASPAADLLVVVPTYTYNAYNYWGGHDQYTDGQPGIRRTFTFHRPSTSTEVEPTGALSHLLGSDLMLLRWMADEGVVFDCVVDPDVHADGQALLDHYRAVLLCTHPEYISDAMRDAFAEFVAAGGRLVYTGGNGFYERVAPSLDGTALTFRRRDGSRDILAEDGLPEDELLGVDFAPDGFLTFAGYRVTDPDHPFLAGTGVTAGEVFGDTSVRIAASGWETDRVPPGGAAEIFAEGEQPFGAQMCRLDHPGGGWTFAAGSLCFNGALDDPVVAGILRNVLAAATTEF